MQNAQAEKINQVTGNVLIVGVDIAKKKNVSRFIDTRGFKYASALSFATTKPGR